MLKKIYDSVIIKACLVSFFPVTLGALLSLKDSDLNFKLYILYYLMIVLFFLINIITDKERNNRELENNKEFHIKVRGTAWILSLVALFDLTYLIFKAGWFMFFIGLTGFCAIYYYKSGLSYRYQSYGIILIAFVFFPLTVSGSYFIQTNNISTLPILSSLPMAFLISAIIHGVDLKNYDTDQDKGRKTLALFMGSLDKKWAIYAQLENYIDAYLVLVILVIFEVFPISSILPIALLLPFYDIFKEIKGAISGIQQCFFNLPDSALKFYFYFSILLILGIVFDKIIYIII